MINRIVYSGNSDISIAYYDRQEQQKDFYFEYKGKAISVLGLIGRGHIKSLLNFIETQLHGKVNDQSLKRILRRYGGINEISDLRCIKTTENDIVTYISWNDYQSQFLGVKMDGEGRYQIADTLWGHGYKLSVFKENGAITRKVQFSFPKSLSHAVAIHNESQIDLTRK